MNKIKKRAYFSLVIAVCIAAGVGIFLYRLWTQGRDWAMLRSNSTAFSEGVLDKGVVTDRNGIVLAFAGNGVFGYSDDVDIRKSCLHAVGDFSGNFGSGALKAFDYKLTGYSFINGLSSLSGKGGQLALSIDSSLNKIAYKALNGRRGAVLVSNYKTGQLICMVSSPSFDIQNPPDLTSPLYEGVYLNRCIGSAYTPGSVFKLITLAAAIETIPDLNERSFFCAGSVDVNGDVVNCTGTHGQQTIEQALANSCNCAFSELSQELGGTKLAEYAEKFGFTNSLKVSGIRTLAGSFDIADDGTSNLSWSGIGQYNDLTTPISMLRYVSAIANGGTVKEPVLLEGAHSGSTKLLDAQTAEKIADMMSYNVAYAYGQAQFGDLKICAKTGTAEVGDGTSHAWFTGFLKDENNPLAFTAIIENAGGGLKNAAPVINAVLQEAVKQNAP